MQPSEIYIYLYNSIRYVICSVQPQAVWPGVPWPAFTTERPQWIGGHFNSSNQVRTHLNKKKGSVAPDFIAAILSWICNPTGPLDDQAKTVLYLVSMLSEIFRFQMKHSLCVCTPRSPTLCPDRYADYYHDRAFMFGFRFCRDIRIRWKICLVMHTVESVNTRSCMYWVFKLCSRPVNLLFLGQYKSLNG